MFQHSQLIFSCLLGKAGRRAYIKHFRYICIVTLPMTLHVLHAKGFLGITSPIMQVCWTLPTIYTNKLVSLRLYDIY